MRAYFLSHQTFQNEDLYEKYPEVKKITKPLAEQLNSDIMRELNYKVDIEGNSVFVVAHDWLVGYWKSRE